MTGTPSYAVTGLPTLERVLSGFDDTGTRWALLRGRASLGVPGRDVDLLVAGADLPRAEDVIFGLGGVALPRSLHPWHRFYVLPDPQSGQGLKLDVVVEILYHRQLRIPSGLEEALLARRVRDGWLWLLDPTDTFWTVLLHCLLDKRAVNERRQDELTAALPLVVSPSPGEELFERLCPSSWSAARALDRVRERDWDALVALGRELVPSSPAPTPSSPTAGSRRAVRWARAAAAAAYPLVWRGTGLGADPHALELADAAAVDVIVLDLRRRPALRELELLVADADHERLVAALRRGRYRRVAGAWTRPTSTGLERVRVGSPSRRGMTPAAWAELQASASPMYRRRHCRRPARVPGGP